MEEGQGGEGKTREEASVKGTDVQIKAVTITEHILPSSILSDSGPYGLSSKLGGFPHLKTTPPA